MPRTRRNDRALAHHTEGAQWMLSSLQDSHLQHLQGQWSWTELSGWVTLGRRHTWICPAHPAGRSEYMGVHKSSPGLAKCYRMNEEQSHLTHGAGSRMCPKPGLSFCLSFS